MINELVVKKYFGLRKTLGVSNK